MEFICSYQWDRDDREDWVGTVKHITSFGSHYEIIIVSRSCIRVLVGKSSDGYFACIPDFKAGCDLGMLDDVFYSSEKLIYSMGNPVDGTTVACALRALANTLKF